MTIDPGQGASVYFTADHRECDKLWADFEEAASKKDAPGALQAWKTFHGRMERHLSLEEEILFPAFEEATGMTGGPTQVMRHEHSQMRGLMQQMDQLAQAGNFTGAMDQGDTLLMIIGQHNMKEENILYRMADQVLAARWSELAAIIQAR